jgi:hypothetical protein
MEGLDGRHRDKNGQIERKHGNTKMRTLKPQYPELKHFRNDDTLARVLERYGVSSLDALLEKLRNK